MTNGELASLAALYLVGIVAGALIGRQRDALWLGIGATLLLGPMLGIPAIWALTGGPVQDLRERL